MPETWGCWHAAVNNSKRSGRRGKRLKKSQNILPGCWETSLSPLLSSILLTWSSNKRYQSHLFSWFVCSVAKARLKEKALINFLYMRKCGKILVSAGTELNSGCRRVCIFNAAFLQVTKIVPHSATLIIWVITTDSHSWCLDPAPTVLSWHSNATSNDNEKHGGCYSTFSPAVSQGPYSCD